MIAGGVERLVVACCARPWRLILGALLLVLVAGWVAQARFAMTTDTAALIAPTVPWRVNEHRVDSAFPANNDTILVVIDGATPERAEQAAAALADAITRDRARFEGVRRPDGGDFFAREGLLFGSTQEVRDATKRMIDAQPFLGPLAADPSLRGIATTLSTILSGVRTGQAKLADISAPMRRLADALEAQRAGRTPFFSWQALLESQDNSRGAALAAPTRRLLIVKPKLDYGSLEPGAAAGDAIRAAAARLGLSAASGARIRLTGSTPLSDEEFASLEANIGLVGAAMLGAMLLTLWLAVRSARIVAAILLTTVAGLVVTAALGLLAVGRFNLISVAFIPLFVGLGVDFGIQLCVRFRAERIAHPGATEALRASAGALGPALLLAAGAICVGFLAFLPTDYIGVSELGTIAGLGMIVALGLSLTLLPALLVLFAPPRPAPEAAWPALARADRLLVERRKWVLGAFVLAMAASIAALPLVRFDFNPLHLRDARGEAMATLLDLMRDPDRSPNTVDVLIPPAQAPALRAKLERLPEVGRVLSIDSFVPADQAPKLAAIGDANTLLGLSLDPLLALPPPSDAETRAALVKAGGDLRAAATDASPAALDARRLAAAFDHLASAPPAARVQATALLAPPLQTMLDQVRAALAATPLVRADLPPDLARDWVAADGQLRLQVEPKSGVDDNAGLARFTRAVRAVAPTASGAPISQQEAARTIAVAFVQAGALAFALVSLLLLAVLRSLRETAFTLAPVILSIFLTLGTCVLIGQPINFANIIAFPLLFGVGVAFHIYFVMAWRSGATDLLQSSLARAVFFSALATGTAFGSLWISDHPGTASMGKILMISLAWTLVCALVFEPALLGPPEKLSRRRAP